MLFLPDPLLTLLEVRKVSRYVGSTPADFACVAFRVLTFGFELENSGKRRWIWVTTLSKVLSSIFKPFDFGGAGMRVSQGC